MLNLRKEASAYHGFGNSFCCTTAVNWDAYEVEITSGKARLCQLKGPLVTNSLCFHPGNRAELFTWQNFPAHLPRSRSRPHTHIQNFAKDLEVR